MPKAEVGSTKYLNNKLKSKGLQRLRWYCQVCERQLRDENAFKMHTQSESHVRQMLIVGEDPEKYIEDYSRRFLSDFTRQLRTAHGEKQVNINHFYQEYIANKEHVHMNATRWPSLTEFAKHLGTNGICRVEETEKGIMISWIDDSPEALRRQEALRRRELMDRGDEAREQMIIREQIKRAQRQAAASGKDRPGEGDEDDDEVEEEARVLKRQDGETVKLSFGGLAVGAKKNRDQVPAAGTTNTASNSLPAEEDGVIEGDGGKQESEGKEAEQRQEEAPKPAPLSLKMTAKPQPKNVFAQARKNALASGAKKTKIEEPKKMSEAERIMRMEMEKKKRPFDRDGSRSGGFGGGDGSFKKQRT